jgi:hypothetical protein
MSQTQEFGQTTTGSSSSSSSSGKWCSRRTLLSIGCGQVLSLLVSGSGVSSGLLASRYGVNIPTSQSFFNYFVMAFVLILAFRQTKDRVADVFKMSLFT